MSKFRPGLWQIEFVLVNEQTVVNNEGFLRLEVSKNEFVIQPIGFRFKVQQLTARTAVLESGGRVYFADFFLNENVIRLRLSRPEIDDTIQIGAKYVAMSDPVAV